MTPANPAAPATATGHRSRLLFVLSLFLFFVWGFATVLIDLLVPKLKGLFELSFAEAMLTQFAFFLGYFVFSLPAGALVGRIGYIGGIVVGLVVMAAGCLMFAPAAELGLYAGFLAALFVMAAGITVLQVAANAVISVVGDASTAPARLTLAQAFNSLGTAIGPWVGARLILGEGPAVPADVSALTPEALAALRNAEASVVQTPFLGIAALLAVLILLFVLNRRLLPATAAAIPSAGPSFALLKNRRLLFGVLAIFTYVGAEVSIGSLLVNYLMEPAMLGATAMRAGQLVSLYWGGAMVGRFVGALILRRCSPGLVLAAFAVGAILLAGVSAGSSGLVAAVAILAVGVCNSIMFPTIFALSVADAGPDAPRASALLCMGIVGGAIVPMLTGLAADAAGLSAALVVPIVCYGWIVFFGAYVDRAARGRLTAGRPDARATPPA